MHRITILMLLLALCCPAAWTQESPPAAAAPRAEEAPALHDAPQSPADGPVAVPEPSELALQRYRSGNVLWIINQLWSIVIPLLFLFSGLSAKIRNWAARVGRWWFVVIALYVAVFMLLNAIIDLPLQFYQTYIRDHAYGLSNQTLQKWTQDALIGLCVGLVIAVGTVWIPYLLLKKSPRRWWLYTAALVPPFLCLQMLITPVFIDPLFNDFGPMQDKALEADILKIAERAGIEGSRVFEVNKSVDTKAVNAYVTGFAGSKRIVLWDTLLAKLDREEVLFVMAHEMGHYVLNHVVKFILFISVVLLLALYLVHRVSRVLIECYRHRWGFDSLADIASFPLILLLLQVFTLAVMPLILAVSRHNEHEADRFGIEITRTSHAAATAFVKLQQENLGVPWHGWLYTLWRDSHPTIGQRITFFNEYMPWEEGKELVYGEYFRDAPGE
jgi:STE24 endopeptidase